MVSSGLVKDADPMYTDDLYDILFDATTIFRPVECTVEAVVVRVFTDLSVSYEACPVSGCNEQVQPPLGRRRKSIYRKLGIFFFWLID